MEDGDIITAYCNDQLVGSVEWMGEFTPVPVMGRDISPQTEGICEPNDVPSFGWRKKQGEWIQELNGEVPGWSSLGVFTIEYLTNQTIEFPTEFVLHPAYPNPFNPVTTISIDVPMVETLRATSLQVFDISGRKIATIVDGTIDPGYHTFEWNAEGLPSGIYFVKLKTGKFNQSQKLMLIKQPPQVIAIPFHREKQSFPKLRFIPKRLLL